MWVLKEEEAVPGLKEQVRDLLGFRGIAHQVSDQTFLQTETMPDRVPRQNSNNCEKIASPGLTMHRRAWMPPMGSKWTRLRPSCARMSDYGETNWL